MSLSGKACLAMAEGKLLLSQFLVEMELNMAEKSTHRKTPFQNVIPEEARTHAQAARGAWRKSVEGLFPAEFLRQRRIAQKETLLAVRSVIDSVLERIDTSDEK
jgi:hypothetical protein